MRSLFNKSSSATPASEQMQLAELNIQIVRSKRKSISLHIKNEEIILRAPDYTPRVMLKAFALSKIEWLRKHLARMQTTPKVQPKSYQDGEQWLFFGEKFRLKISTSVQSKTYFDQEQAQLHIYIGNRVKSIDAFIKKQVASWYKQQGTEYLAKKLVTLSIQMQLEPKGHVVRDYKARWGSCSAKGDLSFNWRIFMAPTEVVDSVIVHELAHLKHFNHSKQFWSLVYSACPNYKEQHEWLKTHQQELQSC